MASLPPALRAGLDPALQELGVGSLTDAAPVGGGCINHGARLRTESGAAVFLKWNSHVGAEVFEAEADGLRALRAARALRVPEPLASGGGVGSPAWLLLEHVPPGRPSPGYDEALGRGLAAVHATAGGTETGSGFGWDIDNWIGSLPQSNGRAPSWADFWRDERIAPQLRLARQRGHLGSAAGRDLDRLVDRVPVALGDADIRPALLHGDLWGGNAYPGPSGEPVVIDPAVYVGHGEVDLAMSELFGGFGRAFYEAYDEVSAVPAAYAEYRRDLYQLYYLLVHVNLFGAGYESGTVAAARRVLAAIR